MLPYFVPVGGFMLTNPNPHPNPNPNPNPNQALSEQSEAREAKVTSLLQQNTALRASHASMDAYASRCTHPEP